MNEQADCNSVTFSLDDLVVNPDDLLPPFVKLEKYSSSDAVLYRTIAARDLLETLRSVITDDEDVDCVFRIFHSLAEDYEPCVRMEIMERVPQMAMLCKENIPAADDLIFQNLLPVIMKYLTDISSQVRKIGHSSLLYIIEQDLVDKVALEEKVLPLVLQLTETSHIDDYRTEAVSLLSRISSLVGKDVTERMFVSPFTSLCHDASFHVRKICAENFGEICTVVGTEIAENIFLPEFTLLCGDSVWGVRKACAEAFTSVSCVCSMDVRHNELAAMFLNLLCDQSRWVRVAAFQSLGPFISTFAKPGKTGLYCDKDGVLTVVDVPNGIYPPSKVGFPSCELIKSLCENGSIKDGKSISESTTDVDEGDNETKHDIQQNSDALVSSDSSDTVIETDSLVICKLETCKESMEMKESSEEPHENKSCSDADKSEDCEEIISKDISSCGSFPTEETENHPEEDSLVRDITRLHLDVCEQGCCEIVIESSSEVEEGDFARVVPEESFVNENSLLESFHSSQHSPSVLTTTNFLNNSSDLDFVGAGNQSMIEEQVNFELEQVNFEQEQLNFEQEQLNFENELVNSEQQLSEFDDICDNHESSFCDFNECVDQSPTEYCDMLNAIKVENSREEELSSDEIKNKLKLNKQDSDNGAFNSFQYWQVPLPEVEVLAEEIESEKCACDEVESQKFSVRNEDDNYDDVNESFQIALTPGDLLRFNQNLHITQNFMDSQKKSLGNPLENGLIEDSKKMCYENILSLLRKCDFVDLINVQTSPVKHTLSPLDQDIVPPELLLLYLSMTNFTKPPRADAEMARHCAYSLPAVALTLGRRFWPCLKQTYSTLASDMQGFIMQWKVRRTLASSLHKLAVILGPDIAAKDLLPIFSGFIRDLDEVRIGILQHLSEFLEVLRPKERKEYLPRLSEFLKTDNDKNWRFRHCLAEQLIPIAQLYEAVEVSQYLIPLALALLQDKVAEVRIAAVHVVAVMVKRMSDSGDASLTKEFLSELEQFLNSRKWLHRQTYVYLCQEFVKENSLLSSEHFSEDMMPQLLYLCWDQVANVRLAVARCLAIYIWPLADYSDHSRPHRELLLQAIHALQEDVDTDVKHFANMVAADECSCLLHAQVEASICPHDTKQSHEE